MAGRISEDPPVKGQSPGKKLKAGSEQVKKFKRRSAGLYSLCSSSQNNAFA